MVLILFNLFLVIGLELGILAYFMGFLCLLISPFASMIFGLVTCLLFSAPIWVYIVGLLCIATEL